MSAGASAVSINLSIDVPRLEDGIRFYCGVFGLSETSRPFPTMAILKASNLTICVHEKPEGSRPTPKHDTVRGYDRHWTPVHIDFHVSDFQDCVARAKSNGATIEHEFNEPKAAAFCADPFGNGFCIIGQ